MNNEKLLFLKNDFIPLLKKIAPDAKGNWGVMNGQQMVEHFIYSVKIANGKLSFPIQVDGERLEKSRAFLMSEIPFKENTKNALLDAEGSPLEYPDMNTALEKLQIEFDELFRFFEDAEIGSTTKNPFFGDLDFEMNVQLLHKHALHHLKQFGIEIP